MPSNIGIWLRQEASPNEQRTPLVPVDAAALIEGGIPVTVEESGHRAFPVDEYAAVGCRIVPGNSWPDAPEHEVVLGVKEPAPHEAPLAHRHVFFGHAYKGQEGGPALLRRFEAGGGVLLDLEYLTDESGRRLIAFGFWAGYVGAALAILHYRGELVAPLRSMTRAELDNKLGSSQHGATALVIGALGRSGRGAVEALAVAGVTATQWDIAETENLDRSALLGHDILVNTVFASEPGTPFLTRADLPRSDRRLTVVSDVTCDVTSACNRIPINDKATDWTTPVRRLHPEPHQLDLLAIDNLPSLLPVEASTAFSAGLLPCLEALPQGSPIWDRCEQQFFDVRALLTSDR